MKANKMGQEEVIEVRLTRDRFPIAFSNKLKELMDCGAFDSEEKAIKWIEETNTSFTSISIPTRA
jgi:hypothetical protein